MTSAWSASGAHPCTGIRPGRPGGCDPASECLQASRAAQRAQLYELPKIPARAIAESRRGKKILCSQPALTCDAQPLAAIRDAIGAQIYLSLTVLRDQGRSIHHSSGTSHNASEPGKLHSRARLRDLDLAWLRTWPGRSALACG